MLAALVLVALVASGPALPPPAPPAIGAVPDEPDAVVLPEAPTYQAVAADLDGDGARDLVRLVESNDTIAVEAWTDASGDWMPWGGLEVVPRAPFTGQGSITYTGAPVQLLVRRVGGADRVTILRQPRFDEPGLEEPCCVLLHDVRIIDGAFELVAVADAGVSTDVGLVVDLDGDGTDEFVTYRSLPPLGDITFPAVVGVQRWSGEAFDAPVLTELPVGSGDAPFILGDSDGRPGDELALIARTAQSRLYRLRLGPGDEVLLDDFGLLAADARAVPIDGGRGLAVIGLSGTAWVVAWPADEPPSPPIAEATIAPGTILGVVDIADEPHLVIRQTQPESLHLLDLPSLAPSRGNSVVRSAIAASFAGTPLTPYVGPIPGGIGGEAAVMYGGRLIPGEDLPDAPFPTSGAVIAASLPGAVPIGLLGRVDATMALLHAPMFGTVPAPSGGPLVIPRLLFAGGVTLAPLQLLLTPEADQGALVPLLRDATPIGNGELGIPARGFVAEIEAPPGSRVYLFDQDPSVLGAVSAVPAEGVLNLPVRPPDRTAGARFRAALAVVTPAGRGYLADWDLRVLGEPSLSAEVRTPLGSADVIVSGRTAPYAQVSVEGAVIPVRSDGSWEATVSLPPWPTTIDVMAVDPVGNRASTTVSGVGWFDYRGLPWVPIAIVLVGLAAALLFLRVPHIRARPIPVTDDAVLEELEPD